MNIVKQIYKSLVPQNLRTRIRLLKNHNTELGVLRKEFIDYYSKIPAEKKSDEINKIVSFVKDNGIATFPYPFIKNYDPSNVEVYKDDVLGMYYVMHEGKRLYFKRSWDEATVRESYNFLLIEQDEQSPHRYLKGEFTVNSGDVVLDIGAAEGNFSLSVVDLVSTLYIFEADSEWIEALSATFAPWNNKVHIINKYVSDNISSKETTVDYVLKDGLKADFIKIDAEGAEKLIVAGAVQTLNFNKSLNVALCTYHKQNDERELTSLMKSYSFNVPLSEGYMFFLEDKLYPPYVRKVLMRAYK